MNANNYQTQAARTLIDGPSFELHEWDAAVLLQTMAVVSISGEVAEHTKKGILHQHGVSCDMLVQRSADLGIAIDELFRLATLTNPTFQQPELDNTQLMLLWNAIGAAGESAEIAATVRQAIYTGDLDRDKLLKEIGDTAWYLAALCTKLNADFGDVLQANIDKLRERFPDGFSSKDSIARRDVKGDGANER